MVPVLQKLHLSTTTGAFEPVDHVVSNFDVRRLLEHVSIWSNEIVIIEARVSTEARAFRARDALCSMRSNLQN
jgi:hypothetical protein